MNGSLVAVRDFAMVLTGGGCDIGAEGVLVRKAVCVAPSRL